jgi:hypothetical protein
VRPRDKSATEDYQPLMRPILPLKQIYMLQNKSTMKAREFAIIHNKIPWLKLSLYVLFKSLNNITPIQKDCKR